MTGIAIVGPHRSGTSAVAGVLSACGVYMGSNMLPPSPTNPMGYFEDADIVALHNEMMSGNWYKPTMRMTPDLMDRYIDKIGEFTRNINYAIKDPRLCYTLPALGDVTLGAIKVIAVYRDPWYSAHSLAERDGVDFSFALNVTLAYYGEMIKNTAPFEMMRIRYTDIIAKKIQSVAAIRKFAGLTDPGGDGTFAAITSIRSSLAHWEAKDARAILRAQAN